ncbi:PAC2 family protein [Amnibacterium sp. CER49]|uniref:PAC2 family protein n=1 Tax=Amnibacterium sp. CER49 TaxID=3039161 RepID=UPI00244B064C|nr:PAC2 family protein [Amnibacterium sp. CER49]MDH2444636.1 PAC2 family protein [Amnibacterium sp. CER49]
MPTTRRFQRGRILVVAFEGWNDAGEAATNAVRMVKDALPLVPVLDIDPELYMDYQFNRPVVGTDEHGEKRLTWPGATMFGPARRPRGRGVAAETPEPGERIDRNNIFVLLGTEPSRSWRGFVAEIIDAALVADVEGVVLLGAMLADVPHTRPISTFASSDDADVRAELDLERSNYEGPVGILSVLSDAAARVGIPSVSIWASVPHYVHNAPSPKATLALLEKLESILDIAVPRGDIEAEASAWESGIDALANDDEDMAAYIEQLEKARDTVDSPEASGEAIAREFERYLRRGEGPGRDDAPPWRPKD